MKEIWKDIEGYEGLYQVSNLGRIKSLGNGQNKKEKIRKLRVHNGYNMVNLHKNNVIKTYFVHRLVAQAFIENPDNLPQVNHKDCNRTNNNIHNLEWCSARYNALYPRTLIKKNITLIKKNFKNNKRILYLLNEIEKEMREL